MSEAQYRDTPALFQPYTNRADLIAEICERLADGEPLASIVRDAHMPGWVTVYAWRDADDEIAERLRHAREVGEEAIAARMRRIASGEEGSSTGDVMRDKLVIDTDFKLLAKFNPKRWGESTQLRHADAEGQKLDTAPLVGELLSLMGQGIEPAPAQPGARVAEVQPAPIAAARRQTQVTYREVAPRPEPARQAPVAQHNARPAYRPRVAREGVDDLV